MLSENSSHAQVGESSANPLATGLCTPSQITGAPVDRAVRSALKEATEPLASRVEKLLGSKEKNEAVRARNEKFTTVERTAEMVTSSGFVERAWIKLKAYLSGEASPLTKAESKEQIQNLRNLFSEGHQQQVDLRDKTLYNVAKSISSFPDPNNKLGSVKTSANLFIRKFEATEASQADGENPAEWPSAAKSTSYAHGTHRNNNDLVATGRNGIMAVDCPGHGEEWIVDLQHPILEEMANAFYEMADKFNSRLNLNRKMPQKSLEKGLKILLIFTLINLQIFC